ncbi:MAG: fumarate reductase/succinate dehydrogenase flavoprotein subunit, partial [Patulibacter sp.]
NRLGASALMQGLADGYFVLPATISDYLAPLLGKQVPDASHPAFKAAEADVDEQVRRLVSSKGSRSVDWFHRELGKILWNECGMARSRDGLTQAIADIRALRTEWHEDVCVPGDSESLNQSLERAGRVEDFFGLGELMCRDALMREESCGGHFRVEHQTDEGEALRDDEDFAFVGAWEYGGTPEAEPQLHREALEFHAVTPTQRSYK